MAAVSTLTPMQHVPAWESSVMLAAVANDFFLEISATAELMFDRRFEAGDAFAAGFLYALLLAYSLFTIASLHVLLMAVIENRLPRPRDLRGALEVQE